MSIRQKVQKKKIMNEYCFSFWFKIYFFHRGYLGITKNGVLKCKEHQIKAHLSLRISKLCWKDSFIGQSQNKSSWLIISVSILDE